MSKEADLGGSRLPAKLARRGRLGWLVAMLVALAGAGTLAPSAQAISRRAAERIALAVLRPSKMHGRIVVFEQAAALQAGTQVGEYDPFSGPRAAGPPAAPAGATHAAAATATSTSGMLRTIRLKHRAWMFWEDLARGAAFEHASYLLLIDSRSGHVIARKGLAWWPLVNGRGPAFVGNDARGRIVYTNIPKTGKAGDAPGVAVPEISIASLRLGGPNDCLFLIGDHTNPQGFPFGPSLAAFGALSTQNGLSTTQATTTIALHNKIMNAVKSKGCKDVMIVLAGHGSPAVATPLPGNPKAMTEPTALPTVELGAFAERPGGPVYSHPVTSQTLKNIMSWYPASVKFKILILSCFSGRFVPALEDDPHIKDGGLIATSSSATEYTWSRINSGDPGPNGFDTSGHEVTNPTDDPRNLPGYVLGLINGIQAILDNPAAYNADGGNLAKILYDAQVKVASGDFTAQLGWVHPAAFFQLPPPDKPPIAAFSFSPNNPPSAPKTGDTVSFDGGASSDPDGTVTGWAWTVGAPLYGGVGMVTVSGGNGPTPSMSFSAPGVYPVTLTVTDNAGLTGSVTHNVSVSGPGSKSSTSFQITCPDMADPTATLTIDIFIPSYAQNPTLTTTFPTICSNSSQSVKTSLITGNDQVKTDEWGQPKNTFHIEIDLTWMSGPAGTATVPAATVVWQ